MSTVEVAWMGCGRSSSDVVGGHLFTLSTQGIRARFRGVIGHVGTASTQGTSVSVR